MKKVIREILTLVWKLLRTYLWKWLRPKLFKYVVTALVVVGAIFVLGFLVVASC